MFTNWEQVKSWIEDNNLQHWVFYKTNPERRADRANDTIIDSNYYASSDMQDKLAMTEKYMRQYGGMLYGEGFKAPSAKVDGIYCEVRLENTQQQQVYGVGAPMQPQIDEAAIERRITEKIQAQYDRKEYERLRKDLDRERKEFEAQKNSAIGAIAHYFAPIGQALLAQKTGMRNVAGFADAKNPVVHTARIAAPAAPEQPNAQEPEQDPAQEQSVWDAFTEEEGEQIGALMARFKAVEPDYLKLIEAVVAMAERNDPNYGLAKKFLV